MVAGFRVAYFGQMRQRPNADALDEIIFLHAQGNLCLKCGFLIFHPVTRPLCFQLGIYSGQHQRRADRLGNVISGTQLQATFLVAGIDHGGEENNRDILCVGIVAQMGNDLETIHVRHHHIK